MGVSHSDYGLLSSQQIFEINTYLYIYTHACLCVGVLIITAECSCRVARD